MRLKKLKILGFKSFADPIKLEFHAGITAIVGPNGCGKSNIADAFRWVLGEQSARSLRGGKMQDIIFAGTSQRKPLNFAEVTLTISEIQESLPLGYDEVAITRRLHRNGESEYFINNQNVRLKDIQDLFLDSGIGKNAFSIFEQGKIDQIIQYSPLERRYIFEEAAGILRFLQRKREALKRLEQVDLNTSRLKDIHLEVERQIIVLEEQSKKALLYKENRALLENLEKTVLIAKWDAAQKKRSETYLKEEAHSKQLEELQKKYKDSEQALMKARLYLSEGENLLKAKNEEVFKTRSDKTIKDREKLTHQERYQEAVEKEIKCQKELEVILQKDKSRKFERQGLLLQQNDQEQNYRNLELSVKEQREKVAAIELQLVGVRESQQASQQKLMSLVQKESRFESDLKQQTIRFENDSQHKLRLLKRKETLVKQIEEMSVQVNDRQVQAKIASSDIDKQKEVLSQLEKQNEELSKEIQKRQEFQGSLQVEIQEGRARHKVLERLRADLEGFSIGSKKLLQESQNNRSPLSGKIKGLYEYLSAMEGFESLLAAAMKPYAQTLVVDSLEDLELTLAFAAKNKLKDYSLVCLEHLSKKRKEKLPAEALTALLTKVKANETAEHFLQKVMIVENGKEAFGYVASYGGEAVTHDGFYIDSKQVLFQPVQNENNVFMREAELKLLVEKLSQLEIQKADCDASLKGLQLKRASTHQQQMEHDKAIRKAEMSLLEINFAIQRLNGDLVKGNQEVLVVEKDLEGLNTQMDHLQSSLKELQQKHREAKKESADFQKQTGTLQEQVNALTVGSKNEQQILKERETAANKIADDIKKISHALHVLEVKDLDSIDQERKLKDELKGIEDSKRLLQGKGIEVDKELQVVEALLEKVTQANCEVENEIASRRKVIEEIEKVMGSLQSNIKQREQDWNQTRIHSAQLESTYQTLESELYDRFQRTLEEVRCEIIPLHQSIDQAEKQIKSLRTQLEEAGDVNLAAIDECDRHKTRYVTLNQQLDDIGMSKQDLVQIIADLDAESRKIFKSTFQEIRANFQKNFQILFNGGEADLQFTDSDEVLEAGIEIIARPPGKQMRSIQLLSGGEKCLTAMALLFAIFEVKPAPFCILDEIDAPLDDANVERFVQMVKHYIDRCQFIIITHNKRTMAIADRIFGVSMEERGISKLLSLEFSSGASVVV